MTGADPFDLLVHFGRDVAGAAWFRGDGDDDSGSRTPLDEAAIAARIRRCRADATAWHDDSRAADGQFSLSGTQTKFSLALHDGRWFETSGSDPSTHLFKPTVQSVPDGEVVEFMTMRAAAGLGLPTAPVELLEFGDTHALVVERFDRVQAGPSAVRLHQEDMVQALGASRLHKYEVQGGPSIDSIIACLARGVQHPEEGTLRRFARVLVFSWIMLNTDAHAKNHAVFVDPDGLRLTPLYDASSVIPYLGPDGLDHDTVAERAARSTLAMRYGASARAGRIGGFEIGAIARRCGLRSADLSAEARASCDALPRLVAEAAEHVPPRVRSSTVERFIRWMPLRARQADAALRRGA